MRDARGRPRAPGRAPGDRRRERREPLLRHSGYDASVDYVVETLEAAGYDPEVQTFDYLAFEVIGPSALQQTAPNPVTYVLGVDFGPITQSDPGDVTAAVTAVDLQLGLGNTSTSGCEARTSRASRSGTSRCSSGARCTFEIKAENAAAAGAVGIVIFNQGNTTATDRNNIPAVDAHGEQHERHPGARHDLRAGRDAVADAGPAMRVFANTLRQMLPTANVLAERTARTTTTS